MTEIVTAAVLVIGNEILSGRTKDANIGYLAGELTRIGIRLLECRVVADVESEIVEAVNALRARYNYVFTTGGIGPTHDDITSGSVARAFGRKLHRHPDAVALLTAHYPPGQLTEARLKMTEVPEGAVLVENPISKAPGFQLQNVFVLAGVPAVARAMFDGIRHRLRGGAPMLSRVVTCHLGEGAIAQDLSAVQDAYPDLDIGSYPFFRRGIIGTSLVARGTDVTRLEAGAEAIREVVRRNGGVPGEEDPADLAPKAE